MDQSYANWECIIINDGSPDNTREVASFWQKKDDRFNYFEQENGGLSNARNTGIQASSGEYIIVLDADDILHPDYIKKLLPVLLNSDKTIIVSCQRIFFHETIDNIIKKHVINDGDLDSILFENQLMPASIFRKTFWEKVGGYDESMKTGFEDWEFWISILKNGGNYRVVNEFLFYYRKSNSSMLIDTLKNHRLAILSYVINKHSDIYQSKFNNTISYLLFLANLYRNSEIKYKNSLEFKMGSIIIKPYRLMRKLLRV